MQSLGGSGKFQGESRTSPGAGRMLGNQHQPGIDQGGTQLFFSDPGIMCSMLGRKPRLSKVGGVSGAALILEMPT